MIRQFGIENFKSHLKTDLALSNLNILAGVNGMGKSSFIQALLVLRQSYIQNRMSGLEFLNADLCKIGSVQDAIAASSSENVFRFIVADSNHADLVFESSFQETELTKTYIPLTSSIPFNSLEKISLFNTNFQYLSAYRNGPSDDFISNTYQVEHLHQISVKEGRAEMTAHFIDYFGKNKITIEELKHPDSKDNLLITQIECWLREFSKNINLHISKSTETSYKIEYSFNRKDKFATNRFKSKNVGFGLTYDLPILTAILSAKPNDLIIIENPEAHIHPSGQAKLMELIGKAAEAGVQFIIETHSDHIVNGALVATKLEWIQPQNIAIYYFDRDEETHSTKAIPLKVEASGKIRKPPEGFFDQIDKDMGILMGF